MNLLDIMAVRQYFGVSSPLSVGDEVTVDGYTGRGTVVQKKGRRVTIQIKDHRGGVGYRNGYRLERDEAAVHKL